MYISLYQIFSKSYKTKNVRRYYIDKIFFFIFAIFSKLLKSVPYLAILLFNDVNLKATVAKLPTFLLIFFTKIVSLVNTFPGPFDL